MNITMMAGESFIIKFADGTIMKTHKVEITNESFQDWKINPNPLKQMFYAYNYPESIDQYKNLFYQGNFPWEIEKIYDDWRGKMNSVTIDVQGIFYGMLDDMEVALVQYSFTQSGNTIQMGFLARRTEGKWYPMEGKLMAQYQHVMALFATLQPGLAACIITPDPQSEYNQTANDLITKCSTNGYSLTEECIYDTAEKWGASEDPTQRGSEARLFKNRMKQEMDPSRKMAIDNALHQYLNTLNIPEEGLKKVIYYFSKNESMKAVSMMYAYGVDIDKATLFSDLNRVQQTSQYRTFEHVIPEKPKSN